MTDTPETPQAQPTYAGFRTQGRVVPGPDGRAWGMLNIEVANCVYKLILPEADLEGAVVSIPQVLAELLNLVKQANGTAITVPGGGIILPEGYRP